MGRIPSWNSFGQIVEILHIILSASLESKSIPQRMALLPKAN